MPNLGKLMKQAARVQQQIEQTQAQLAARTVEASSGGGAVKVVAKCDGSVASIKISPQAVNPADAQLLETYVDTPLFVVTAAGRQRDGDMVHVSRTAWVAGRVRFHYLHRNPKRASKR